MHDLFVIGGIHSNLKHAIETAQHAKLIKNIIIDSPEFVNCKYDNYITIKGNISTQDYLKRIIEIHKANGNTNRLSHCCILENDDKDIKFILTDAAFNTDFINNGRIITENAIWLSRQIYNQTRPIINYILAENKPNIPGYLPQEFLDYIADIGNVIHSIQCKQFDMALDPQISKLKNDNSPQADILIVSDINVGNAIWKSLTIFGGFLASGFVVGTDYPCLLNSRGDDACSFFRSIQHATNLL